MSYQHAIRGGGDLGNAIEHSARLLGLVKLDEFEMSVPGLPEATRRTLMERMQRNRARMIEIDTAIRRYRGY